MHRLLRRAQGTEIRATFFREAVDKFFEQLHEDQVYTFSKGRLKVANQASVIRAPRDAPRFAFSDHLDTPPNVCPRLPSGRAWTAPSSAGQQSRDSVEETALVCGVRRLAGTHR